MSDKKLAAVFGWDKENTIQWEVAVPIATNPFTLIELFQTSLIGAGVALSIMACGVWVLGDGLLPGDLPLMFGGAAVFFATASCVFLVVGGLVFRNRYFVSCSLTPGGVYLRYRRGRDESGSAFLRSARPVPIVGAVTGKKHWEKELSWDKVDRFIDFASMRSVQLKRGRWSMLRLYTPDAATHARVVAHLAARLKQIRE